MAKIQKTIGKVPVYRGHYQENKLYYLYNIVSYMGSSFVCVVDNTNTVPCIEQDGTLILSDDWDFFADASFGVKMINEREEDIEKSTFDQMKETGQLNPNKRYYIYELET